MNAVTFRSHWCFRDISVEPPGLRGYTRGPKGRVTVTAFPRTASQGRVRPTASLRLPGRAGALVVLALAACGGSRQGTEREQSMRRMDLAQGLFDEGNVPGALLRADEAVELDPDNARARLLRAYIRLEARRPGAARDEDLALAAADARRALALVQEQEAVALVPQARNVLGAVLVEQGQYDEAISVLEAAAIDPVNTSPDRAWATLGRARHLSGDAPGAVEAFEQAVRMNPRFCLAYYWLGEAHFEADEYDEAEAALTLALEADERCERFQQAWLLRGETRARLGQREDALRDFERCVELAPRTDDGRACAGFLEEAP